MFTIGADPEVFVINTVTNQLVPSCGLFGGTKARPKSFGRKRGYNYQEDNVMLEFNIPAMSNPSRWYESIKRVRNYAHDLLHTTNETFDIAPECEYLFPESLLTSPGAATFGCAPDYNAYATGEAYPRLNQSELYGKGGEWRFAGGHIHFGYKMDIPPYIMAQFFDAFVGLRLVPHDKQPHRRALYGQAGRHRPTAYGIEYRTPSNTWFCSDKITVTVAEGVQRLIGVLTSLQLPKLQELYTLIPWKQVQDTINNEDCEQAPSVRRYIEEASGSL